jgi:NAD(P)H-hydrate epimerase
MPGAVTLVAKAAIKAGAGLVTVASIPAVCNAVAAHLPEVLLLPLEEQDGVIAPDAAESLLRRQDSYDAAAFGPGMTSDEPIQEFLGRLWPRWHVRSVIDADALNCVAKGVPLPACDCVLTPHPGEIGRLMKMSVAEVQSDRFRAVSEAAKKLGKTVLLKGPFTLVSEPGEPTSVNTTGNSGMATGGMGDTLTGIVGTLVGQDLPTYYAAICGAYWHGLAADLCACEIGPVGYTATEVSSALPSARVRILSSCELKPPCS